MQSAGRNWRMSSQKGRIPAKLDLKQLHQLVVNAHATGLKVHPYTFRTENTFLPANLKNGDDPNAIGDSEKRSQNFPVSWN